MQKLHLVGFTPELDGLILSTRKGAKSGSFVVPVDASLLEALAEAKGTPESAARKNGARPRSEPRQTRPESQLGPREMQELLRGGWSLEEVAVEAGVDVDWVSRFAAPVLAEMRLVLDQARDVLFVKPRVGPSALTLAASVRRNVAERGVRFTDEDFDECWRAHQLDEELWVVAFEYVSRARTQLAEWTLDLESGELISRGRLGTQLGHVQSTRRRVSTAPPPKPKPKAAAARAVRKPPEPEPTVARRATPPRATAARGAPAAPARNRARQSGMRAPSAGAKKRAPAGGSAKPPGPARPPADPWRDELRRREAERIATSPPPPPAPRRSEPSLRPVATIGPTVRTLTTRPAPPSSHRDLPDLEWRPVPPVNAGPLPAPGPLPVPDRVREKLAEPLGQVEDLVDDVVGDADDGHVDEVAPAPEPERRPTPVEPLAPVRPRFRGAITASEPSPAPTPPPAPAEAPRRRRSEPLRAR